MRRSWTSGSYVFVAQVVSFVGLQADDQATVLRGPKARAEACDRQRTRMRQPLQEIIRPRLTKLQYPCNPEKSSISAAG